MNYMTEFLISSYAKKGEELSKRKNLSPKTMYPNERTMAWFDAICIHQTKSGRYRAFYEGEVLGGRNRTEVLMKWGQRVAISNYLTALRMIRMFKTVEKLKEIKRAKEEEEATPSDT